MKNILFISLLSFMMCSCADFLDEKTYSQLTPENAYLSKEGANKAMNGAYAMLQDGFDYKFSIGIGILGTDEATSYNDTYGDHEILLDKYTYSSEYDVFQAVYIDLFEGVKRCNVIVDLLPDDVEDRELFVAQAKFLRGIYYFELVNLFGGVPLWLSASADKDNLKKPRASVDEIYAQIEQDLLAAEEDLPLVNVWEEGRATKYAAQAMLARMYLQRHDYENALKYCNLVIGDGNNFHLYNNYADIYDPANKNQGYENIFEIQHRASLKSEDEGSTSTDFFLPIELQGTIYTGWAMYGPTDYLYNSYEPNDKRKAITYITSGVNSAGQTVTFKPHCFKYYNRTEGFPVNDGEQNFPLIRYADVLLMKAEAINGLPAENGQQTKEKFQCLNDVRSRAGLDAIENAGENTTKEGFLETLLEERLHELCFEKSRRKDLIRNNKLQSYVTTRKPDRPVPDKAKEYYPLPLAATDANSLLEQLPGY